MNPNTTTRFQAVMREIWPTVYKVINTSVYFVFGLIRSMIKIIIQQIENK